MTSSPVRTILLVVAIGIPGAPALAQSVFVQGAYGPDVRRFSGDDTERVFDTTSGNLALAIAGFVGAHVSAGIELDFGGTSTEARTVNLTISGRPATITTEYSLQRRSVSALAGLHTSAARRARFSAYAGLSFSSVRREIVSDAPPIVLSDPPGASVFTDRAADPVVGADAAIALGGRIAVVGGVRAHGLVLSGDLRGFTIRPRAGVRISF